MKEIINELSVLICQCIEIEYIASLTKQNNDCENHISLCRCSNKSFCDIVKRHNKTESELNTLKVKIADIVIENALDILVDKGLNVEKFNIAKCQLNNGLNRGIVPKNVIQWYKKHNLKLPF